MYHRFLNLLNQFILGINKFEKTTLNNPLQPTLIVVLLFIILGINYNIILQYLFGSKIEKTMIRASISRLAPKNSVLFVCDIQERFRPLIYRSESVINRSVLLRNACKVLQIPIIVTEQNPKIFGASVSELKVAECDDAFIFAKKKFSMLTPEVIEKWDTDKDLKNRHQVIIVGIEAHVCVLQTVLDIFQTKPNFDVFVICDAVSSQRSHDRSVALARMEKSGATLCTSESAIFDLMKTAEHPDFRTVSGLCKIANSGVNEFNSDVTI